MTWLVIFASDVVLLAALLLVKEDKISRRRVLTTGITRFTELGMT